MTLRCALLSVVVAAACQEKSDSAGSKRAPTPPPPEHTEIPANLAIEVEVDGVAADPIDAARLEAVKPDFADADRRAWKLIPLLGAAAQRKNVVIEAVGPTGVAIALRKPASDKDPQPVLALTRRGEISAAVVPADDPFPDYHGRGGRLKRPGDPLPRVTPVVKLRVGVDQPGEEPYRQASAGALAGIKITVGGAAGEAWSAERVAPVKPVSMETEGGVQQDAWSLRDLVHALVGPNAHATALRGEEGKSITIDDAAWADASRTPVLRANRRGLIKFQWVKGDGTADTGGDLRGVTEIDIAP